MKVSEFFDRIRKKRKLKKTRIIQNNWRIARDRNANTGYRKNAVKRLCDIAGGWRRIEIQSGLYSYIDITLSNGYEVSGYDWCYSKDEYWSAARNLIKYIYGVDDK